MKIVNQNAELPKNAKSKVEESQKQYQQGKFTEFSVVKEMLLARTHRK